MAKSAKSEELIQDYLRLLNQESDEDARFQFRTLEFYRNTTYTQGFNSYCGALTDFIEKQYKLNKASDEEWQKKIEIVEELEEGLDDVVFDEPIKNREYELTAILPFGTGAEWGLGLKGDDLDITLFVDPKLDPEHDHIEKFVRARTKAIFKKIYRRIVKKKMLTGRKFQNIRMDYRSKHPRLTGMVDEFKFEIRLSFTDAVSPKYINAEMVEAYGKFDIRFTQLAMAVQKLHRSKRTSGNDAYWRDVFPNGMTTVLMVLVFMKHFKLVPNIKEKRNGREYSDKAVEKWKKNNKCEVKVGTLFMMFLHFYGNTVWEDTYGLFGKTLNVADGSLTNKKSWNPNIEIIDDSEDKRFRAEYKSDLSEYVKQILTTQGTLRNTPPSRHVPNLFNEQLIPRISMRKPSPFNDDPEYDSEDDAKTRKRKAERKRIREEKEKRREERRAQGIEDDEDEEEDTDSEDEEAPARKLRKKTVNQRGAY